MRHSATLVTQESDAARHSRRPATAPCAQSLYSPCGFTLPGYLRNQEAPAVNQGLRAGYSRPPAHHVISEACHPAPGVGKIALDRKNPARGSEHPAPGPDQPTLRANQPTRRTRRTSRNADPLSYGPAKRGRRPATLIFDWSSKARRKLFAPPTTPRPPALPLKLDGSQVEEIAPIRPAQ